MQPESYTFVETVDDVRSVRLDHSKEEDSFLLTWERENGTFRVNTTAKLSLEGLIATQKLIGDFLELNKEFVSSHTESCEV